MPRAERPAPAGSKARLWCFTIQLGDDPVELPSLTNWPDALAICFQEELAPTTNQRHLQGVVRLNRPFSLRMLKDALNGAAHWEICRSLKASLDYCRKDASRIPGGSSLDVGDWGHQGKSSSGSKLDALGIELNNNSSMTQADLARGEYFSVFARHPNIIAAFRSATLPPRDRTVPHKCVLVYGKSGLGKSYYAAETYPDAYRKPGGKWFEGYSGQSVVLMEDFVGADMPLKDWVRVVDPYPLQVEFKGGFVQLVSTTTVITSNHAPHQWWQYSVLANGRLEACTRRITSVVWFTHYQQYRVFDSYAEFAQELGFPVISDDMAVPDAPAPRPTVPFDGYN